MAKDMAERSAYMRMFLFTAVVIVCSSDAFAEQPNKAAFPVSGSIMRMIKPSSGQKIPQAQLVERGRQIFTSETFNGNGRTCATCHPSANNFTLDPEYIARLPPSDPLFVAETNPALAGLENPTLLRRFALITENLDGFDQPGVLRGVPHTLGLGLTTTPEPGFPLAAATGWSGDGAPGDGSLRLFAVGAVVQHFTKTLARVPGKDFRLPTEDELDALLAFQLSLGAQQEPSVDPSDAGPLAFRDAAVEDGKALFHGAPARDGGTRSCAFCHDHAGANDSAGNNRNFATGTDLLPNDPACLAPGAAPGDGGFGKDPVQVRNGAAVCGSAGSFNITYRGAETFNVPSLLAAAETPPFFHNNSAATIEDAVAFYTSDTFNNSPAGGGRAFALDATGIQHVAAFLRAINAYENVVDAIGYIDQGTSRPPSLAKPYAVLALIQANDAITVLTQGPIDLFTDTQPIGALRDASAKLTLAARRANPTLLPLARVDLERARSLMVQ